MTIRMVNGKRYDFQELSLEDSLEIEEMIPAFYEAYKSGKPLPRGTLMHIAKKVFAFCMVDGKDMGDPSDYFASVTARAEFHLALMEGLKLNFSDLFMKLIASFAGEGALSKLMEKMSAQMTSNQATPDQPD
ncbi:MAG: hypothetical protein ACRCYD_09525 [Plesiomonas sp.]